MVREEHSVPYLCGHGLWVEGRKEGLGEKAAQCFCCYLLVFYLELVLFGMIFNLTYSLEQ